MLFTVLLLFTWEFSDFLLFTWEFSDLLLFTDPCPEVGAGDTGGGGAAAGPGSVPERERGQGKRGGNNHKYMFCSSAFTECIFLWLIKKKTTLLLQSNLNVIYYRIFNKIDKF